MATLRDESQDNVEDHPSFLEIARSFRERCPPGLWCGKKREVPEYKSITDKATDNDPKIGLARTFEKRCPPGLWCGKKREMTLQSMSAEEGKEAPKHQGQHALRQVEVNDLAKQFQKRCPPGLWCGK